jgi:hypothetical protein
MASMTRWTARLPTIGFFALRLREGSKHVHGVAVDLRESFRRHVVIMPRHVSRDAPPISTDSDMLAVVEEVITAASNPLNE